jgi:protein phosphatase
MTESPRLTAAVRTDVGRLRDNNEDSFGEAWFADGSLFVMVADGMGGQEAGEVASSLAVRVVREHLEGAPDGDPRERLHDGLLQANEAILAEGRASGIRGMGTTAVVALLRERAAWIAQVGDSRVYHFRRGHRMFRTRDHTRVQSLVDSGALQEHEVRTHPEAGMLTRALGHPRMSDGRPLVPEVLQAPLQLEANDVLVLSSDGLHDLVDDDEIGQIVASATADDAARQLVQLACDRGGHDNVTVAVVVAGERGDAYDAGFVPMTVVEDADERIDHPADVTYNDQASHLDEIREEERAAREAPVAEAAEPETPAEPSGRVALGLAAASVVAVVVASVSALLGLAAWWYWV